MEDQSQKTLRRRKPFRLLGKMETTEIGLFRLFLESRLVNPKPDQKLIHFFDHCERIQLWHSDIDKAAFEKATGLVMNDNAFDKLVSKLYNQLTTYAALKEFLDATPQQAQYAVKYFERNGIAQEELDKKVKEGKRELSSAVKNEAYYRMMLDLELESAEQSMSRTQTPEARGLASLHNNLDGYFLIMKLRFLCASANEQRIFGSAASNVMNETGIAWLGSMYPAMPLLAKVYFHAFHILNDWDGDNHLEEFQNQLQQWDSQSTTSGGEEFLELNGYLLNHYVRKMNAGNLNAVAQVHHFYTKGIEEGWLLTDGKLSPEHFKNIVTLRLRMNKVVEARAFHKAFQQQLTDNQGGAVQDYTEAILQLNEKRYNEVIPKLEALIESKGSIKADQFYGLDLRCTLLKAYYEYLTIANQREWDEIDDKLRNLLNAFPSYIARKNLPKITQVRFNNFRNTMHRLYSILYDLPKQQRRQKMDELLLDLKSSSNLPDIGWFLQKATAFAEK